MFLRVYINRSFHDNHRSDDGGIQLSLMGPTFCRSGPFNRIQFIDSSNGVRYILEPCDNFFPSIMSHLFHHPKATYVGHPTVSITWIGVFSLGFRCELWLIGRFRLNVILETKGPIELRNTTQLDSKLAEQHLCESWLSWNEFSNPKGYLS